MTAPHILAGVTPGPWTYHRLTPSHKSYVIYRSAGPYTHVATLHDVSEGDQVTNAKLIALLPEMFDALVELTKAVGSLKFEPITHSAWDKAVQIINQINPLIL
jgi:hypothetical protein